MSRRVKRAWTTKSGAVRTREYTYGINRGAVLVDKRGRLLKKKYNEYVESIMNNNKFSESTKRTLVRDLENYISEKQKTSNKRVTIRGFEGHRADNEVSRFFANAGYTTKEFADEVGIAEAKLFETKTNEDGSVELKNWKNGQFIIDEHSKIEFTWTYTGKFWKRVEI